jgi:hypothetical protein
MATDILAGGLGEIRAASTASGGTALSTTATYIPFGIGAAHVFITPREFATAVVARIAINPYLVVLKTADAMATLPTDYSQNAQDGDASTVVTLSSLDTYANGDYLLVGAHLPIRGVYVDMSAAVNGNASILTVYYRKSDDTWADSSATDGTTSGGATFAQDGLVYWTVPTDWKLAKLTDIFTGVPSNSVTNTGMYWTQWRVSAALDASTTASAMLAANRSTAYAEFISGQVLEQRIKVAPGGVGCVEALTDAGTANLIVNVASERDGRL